MDVLSASYEDDKIAWYENNGNESFTAHTITTSADGVYSVFACDVDGDGDMDVLSASYEDDKIAWYENDGSESFTAHNFTTSADGAFSVFATDVDGDGDMDVLSASQNDDKIAWYENDGSQNFAAHNITTSADSAQSVFASDVDGDGDMDVLSASEDDYKITWYENNGSESFTAHTITTSAYGASSVFATDVDGDGDMDVLSASAYDDKIAWYENNGSETFTAHTITTSADGTRSVFACDIDGDGDIDVLSASADDTIAWYENDGSQNFTTRAITTSADNAKSVFSCDVDGDGDMDVLSASESDDKIAWYEQVEIDFGDAPMTPPGNALSFDGANDYVNVIQNSGLPIYNNGTSNAYTVCLWVKGGAQNDKRVFSEGSGGDDVPLFTIGTDTSSSDKLRMFIRDNSGTVRLPTTSASSVFDNTWHHIAWVDNNGTATLYIDGKADASDFNYTRGTLTLDKTSIGAVLGSSPSHYFLGGIDDVSIWNVARSQSDIQDNMHRVLNGDESNLIAYYHFDHTSGTALSDRTTNDNDGTLTNMTDDDWVTSTAPFGEDGTLVLTQTQTNIGDEGKQMQVTITTGGDASNYLGIYRTGDGDSPISDETFPDGVTQRSDILWGVEEYGEVTTDLVIDYSNVAGITDPSAMQLLKRTDAASDWTNATGYTHDTGNRTFSKTGEADFSEFSIGDDGDNSLPVELSSFTATFVNDGVILKWRTETEVNNIGFGIYRSEEEDGDYTKMGFVNGVLQCRKITNTSTKTWNLNKPTSTTSNTLTSPAKKANPISSK